MEQDKNAETQPTEAQFTSKQRRFIEVYAGNGTDAARIAGYQGDANVLGVTAYDLLRNPKIAQAIAEREERAITGLIATREERQAFWTQVMNSTGVDMRDRLKAAELLGKSQADFTEKVEHAGPGGQSLLGNLSDDQLNTRIAAMLSKQSNGTGPEQA